MVSSTIFYLFFSFTQSILAVLFTVLTNVLSEFFLRFFFTRPILIDLLFNLGIGYAFFAFFSFFMITVSDRKARNAFNMAIMIYSFFLTVMYLKFALFSEDWNKSVYILVTLQ
jgi:hypothetical protein